MSKRFVSFTIVGNKDLPVLNCVGVFFLLFLIPLDMNIIFLCTFLIFVYAKDKNKTYNEMLNTFLKNLNNYTAEPDWDKLDMRPIPSWYDEAKIGIFVHWGLYSVPGFRSEWFWYYMSRGDGSVKEFMSNNSYKSYLDFAPMFTAEKFEPDKWAELFAKSGAKYVVLTTKHHDGFALFPSGRSNWNSVDVGPKIDIVEAVATAVRKQNLRFGIYYSLTEWFNKLIKDDKKNKYKTTVYPDTIVWPDIKYLVNTYKPSVLWSDGDWDGSYLYWKSRELLTWLYNESPVKNEIVVNDRWGNGTNCKHGDYYNCDDRYNPGYAMLHKWENAFTIDKESWGYRSEIRSDELMTIEELLEQVVSTVSCGGNALINVGPSKEGIIIPIFQERLLQLGDWLKINGEAIYKTSPWSTQRDTLNADVWYTAIVIDNGPFSPTMYSNTLYMIFLKWPENDKLIVQSLRDFRIVESYTMEIFLREGRIPVKSRLTNEVVEISLPAFDNSTNRKYAWTIKITELS